MKQTITIEIVNGLTGVVMVKNSFEVSNYKPQTMVDNAYSFRSLIPEGQISVSCSNGDFVSLMPLEMELDEERLSFDEFMSKWYLQNN